MKCIRFNIYFQCAIRLSTYTQNMVAKIAVYILYQKSLDIKVVLENGNRKKNN